jgi:hypothetical protein
MASVYLLSVADPHAADSVWARSAYQKLYDSACSQPHRQHHLTDDTEAADLILFAELGVANGHYSEHIRKHPLFSKYRKKCFAFINIDYPMPLVPGMYTSVEHPYAFRSYVRSGFYLTSAGNPHIDQEPWPTPPKYLFSFVGSADNHPVRQRLMQLQHPTGYVEDTSGKVASTISSGDAKATEKLHQHYAKIMAQSAFVLCPRGIGCSSMRVFEAMQMGRPPVIFSDKWVKPEGPDWDKFSITIPERHAGQTPSTLEAYAEKAQTMGKQAREAWEAFFGPQRCFHTVVEACLSIQACRRLPEPVYYYLGFGQLLLQGSHLKRFVGRAVRKWLLG